MRLFSLLVRFNKGLLSTDQDTCIPITTPVNTRISSFEHELLGNITSRSIEIPY